MRRDPAPAPAEERATGADGRLDLSRMILLGVFGSDAAPRALVRLPSGEVRRVAAGQTVGGWRVEAVGPDFVSLRSSGAARRLRLP
ncbi:MAG: amidophosphoribosyltransferase [Pseudomonadota bacterium]